VSRFVRQQVAAADGVAKSVGKSSSSPSSNCKKVEYIDLTEEDYNEAAASLSRKGGVQLSSVLLKETFEELVKRKGMSARHFVGTDIDVDDAQNTGTAISALSSSSVVGSMTGYAGHVCPPLPPLPTSRNPHLYAAAAAAAATAAAGNFETAAQAAAASLLGRDVAACTSDTDDAGDKRGGGAATAAASATIHTAAARTANADRAEDKHDISKTESTDDDASKQHTTASADTRPVGHHCNAKVADGSETSAPPGPQVAGPALTADTADALPASHDDAPPASSSQKSSKRKYAD